MKCKKETKKETTIPSDLKVYPVKVDEDDLGEKCKEIIPDLVHFIVLLGKIRSGKSVLMQNLYLSPRFYGDDYDIKVLISPSVHNDTMLKHMVDSFDYVFDEYSEDLFQVILDMIKNDEEDNRYLLVMDDIMGDTGFVMKKNGKQDLFSSTITKFRHIGSEVLGTEGRLAICLSCQRYKFLTPTIRQNVQGLHIMGSFPESELKKIAEDYSFIGGSEKEFLRIFYESRKSPFDFTYINVPKLEAWRNYDELLWSADAQYENPEKIVDEMETENKKEESEKNNIK
tara:strand:- start:671 stop:1522 length:852 start_codon:yes stop_codon:yes gene_type:complete